MPLNLHQSCKERLKSQLGQALSNVRVKNLSFIDRLSLGNIIELESILPTSGDIRANLEIYISESPLYDFIYGTLSKQLNDEQPFNAEHRDELLSFVSGYSDLESVSSDLVEQLDSLPWQYCITFKLNSTLFNYIENEVTEISSDIKILKSGNELIYNFPLNSGIGLRDQNLHGGSLLRRIGSVPTEWEAGTVYIQISVNGFIGKYVDTNPLTQALDTFKSVLGLLIAQRALKIKYSYSSSTSKSRAYIHRRTEKWDVENSTELASEVSKTILDLELDDLNGALESDLQKTYLISQTFNNLKKALSKNESEKLRLAGRWLFDSYCGSNELLSFIQTTVSLEILLGEKAMSDLMGLGELLRNRCAYLIGKTHSQREEVLNDFKKIYDILTWFNGFDYPS